jgi:AcrR family transcriptional regulator
MTADEASRALPPALQPGAVATSNSTPTPEIKGLREARRQQRIELSREQILDTAESVFAEYGFYDASLKEIALRCEFSVGSIYTFFQNKENLFEEVLMRGIELQGNATRQFAPESMPANERLVTIAKLQIEHMRQHLAWNMIAIDTARITQIRGGIAPAAYQDYVRKTIVFLREVIEGGQREGTVREGDPETLARLYYAVLTSYVASTAMFGAAEDSTLDVDLYIDYIRTSFSAGPGLRITAASGM